MRKDSKRITFHWGINKCWLNQSEVVKIERVKMMHNWWPWVHPNYFSHFSVNHLVIKYGLLRPCSPVSFLHRFLYRKAHRITLVIPHFFCIFHPLFILFIFNINSMKCQMVLILEFVKVYLVSHKKYWT